MIKTVTIFKRGTHLTGTIFQDTELLNGAPFFAEIDNDGVKVKSPHYVDEDVAMDWIESQFEERISRKFKKAE